MDCEDGWGLCNCQVFPNCPTGGAGFEASLNSVTREIILKNNDDVIKGDTLYIDDDLVLPKDYADSEGYDSITILEGKYLVAHDAGACISVVKVKLD